MSALVIPIDVARNYAHRARQMGRDPREAVRRCVADVRDGFHTLAGGRDELARLRTTGAAPAPGGAS